MDPKVIPTQVHRVKTEPYYASQGSEIELFEAAYRNQIPILLKGPTGCGKTRFMEHMAFRLSRPLVTVSCHDDLTASDLVGRFLIVGGGNPMGRRPVSSSSALRCIVLPRRSG